MVCQEPDGSCSKMVEAPFGQDLKSWPYTAMLHRHNALTGPLLQPVGEGRVPLVLDRFEVLEGHDGQDLERLRVLEVSRLEEALALVPLGVRPDCQAASTLAVWQCVAIARLSQQTSKQ
eukprot:4224201-Lingulodinium_polyedra.AAC.2